MLYENNQLKEKNILKLIEWSDLQAVKKREYCLKYLSLDSPILIKQMVKQITRNEVDDSNFKFQILGLSSLFTNQKLSKIEHLVSVVSDQIKKNTEFESKKIFNLIENQSSLLESIRISNESAEKNLIKFSQELEYISLNEKTKSQNEPISNFLTTSFMNFISDIDKKMNKILDISNIYDKINHIINLLSKFLMKN